MADGPVLPSDHPLVGCEHKFWRAHAHFVILMDRIASEYGTGDIDFVTLRGELKPNAKDTFRYVVDTIREPDLTYATLIGDIVHNLRSSLDQLVFELSFLGTHGKRIPGKVAYPCSFTQAQWRSKWTQNTLLSGVLMKHRAIIYRTQPCYRRRDDASPASVRRRPRNELADLQNLWNHDKHRMLQPVHLMPLNIGYRVKDVRDCEIVAAPRFGRRFFDLPLERGTEVLTIPIRNAGPDPYVDVQFRGESPIGFRNGLDVLKGLASIGSMVQSTLTRFEREFETPEARQLWGRSRQGWLDTDARRSHIKQWVSTKAGAIPPEWAANPLP